MESGRKPRSLLDMCVQKLIDNLRYVVRVDGIEMELLKRILPHCTLEQLTRIENRTEVGSPANALLSFLWRLCRSSFCVILWLACWNRWILAR